MAFDPEAFLAEKESQPAEPAAPVYSLPFGDDDFKSKRKRAAQFDPYIDLFAKDYEDLPDIADLTRAALLRESGGRTNAQSSSGAVGLMQMLPSTFAEQGGEGDPFNAIENIQKGMSYLADQYRKFGTPELALAAYNAGPGNVRKHKGIPPFPETQDYVNAGMGYYTALRSGTAPAADDDAPPAAARPTPKGKVEPGMSQDLADAVNNSVNGIEEGDPVAPVLGSPAPFDPVAFLRQAPDNNKGFAPPGLGVNLPPISSKFPSAAEGPKSEQVTAFETLGKSYMEDKAAYLKKHPLGIYTPEKAAATAGGKDDKRSFLGKTLGDILGSARDVMTVAAAPMAGKTYEQRMGERYAETAHNLEQEPVLKEAKRKLDAGESLTPEEDEAIQEHPGFIKSMGQFIEQTVKHPVETAKDFGIQAVEDLPAMLLGQWGAEGAIAITSKLAQGWKAARSIAYAEKLATRAAEAKLAKPGLAREIGKEAAVNAAQAPVIGSVEQQAKGGEYSGQDALRDVATSVPFTFMGAPSKLLRNAKDPRPTISDLRKHPAIGEMMPKLQHLLNNPETSGIGFLIKPKEDGTTFWSREDLDNTPGYEHMEPGEYTVAGKFEPKTGTVTLQKTADASTVMEESVHYLQKRIRDISAEQGSSGDPENQFYTNLQEKIGEWETAVRAEAKRRNVTLPAGDELLGQAMTAHLGYADAYEGTPIPRVVVPDAILEGFNKLLGNSEELKGSTMPDGDLAASTAFPDYINQPKPPLKRMEVPKDNQDMSVEALGDIQTSKEPELAQAKPKPKKKPNPEDDLVIPVEVLRAKMAAQKAKQAIPSDILAKGEEAAAAGKAPEAPAPVAAEPAAPPAAPVKPPVPDKLPRFIHVGEYVEKELGGQIMGKKNRALRIHPDDVTTLGLYNGPRNNPEPMTPQERWAIMGRPVKIDPTAPTLSELAHKLNEEVSQSKGEPIQFVGHDAPDPDYGYHADDLAAALTNRPRTKKALADEIEAAQGKFRAADEDKLPNYDPNIEGDGGYPADWDLPAEKRAPVAGKDDPGEEILFQLRKKNAEQSDMFGNKGRVASQGFIKGKGGDKGLEDTPLFGAADAEENAKAAKDQQSLFQLKKGDKEKPPKKNLAAIHNLSAENLEFADKLGGIAAPSVGITKHNDPFQGFGDISLIGSKHLIDPASGTPVYDADAYSARFPRQEYKPAKSAIVQKLVDNLRPFAKAFDDRRSLDEVWENAVNHPDPETSIRQLSQSSAAKAAFLASQGIDIKPKMKTRIPRHEWSLGENVRKVVEEADIERLNHLGASDPENNALRKAMGDALIKDAKAKAKTPEDRKHFLDGVKEHLLDDKGEVFFSYSHQMIEDVQKAKERQVDGDASNRALHAALKGKESEFTDWVKNQILPMHGDPYIKVKGRKAPVTLGNAVEEMTSNSVTGKEKTMTFGAGKARAAMSKKYESLEEIQADRDNVVGPKHHEAAKEAAEKIISGYRDAAMAHFTQTDWRGKVDTWAGLDASMKALADAAKKKFPKDGDIRVALARNGFSRVSDNVVSMAREALTAMRNTPVDYLEAKPQRGVRLKEFSGAVIPKNAPASTREILTKHGIPFKEYDSAKQGTRESTIAKFTHELNKASDDVLFQLRPARKPQAPAPAPEKPAAEKPKGKTIPFPGKKKPVEGAFIPEGAGNMDEPAGAAPRVDERVGNLRATEAAAGLPPANLARDVKRTWASMDEPVRQLLMTHGMEHFEHIMKTRILSDVEGQAFDAIVKGKAETMREAQDAMFKADAKGKPAAEAEALGAAAEYAAAQVMQINGLTETARALAAAARRMKGAKPTDAPALVKALAKALPDVGPKDIATLLHGWQTSPEQFADLLRGYANPGKMRKLGEFYRAGLLSWVPTHLRNIAGNMGEDIMRFAETPMAAGLDQIAQTIHGGKRTRYAGEVGAEVRGMAKAFPGALNNLAAGLKSIYRDDPMNMAEPLERQIGAVGSGNVGHVEKAVGKYYTRPIFKLLGIEDRFFRDIGGTADLHRLALRKAFTEGKSGTAATTRANAIMAQTTEGLHPEILREVKRLNDERVFQEDPGQFVRTLSGWANRTPLGFFLPFVRTPANLARRTMQRTPFGFIKATKEWKAWRKAVDADAPAEEIEMHRGLAMDAGARALVGSTMLSGFAALAGTGIIGMTGGGPSDRKEKNLKRESGWQPYSFFFKGPDGKQVYVPYAWWEPVSSLLGMAADMAESNTPEGYDYTDAVQRVGNDLISKTYLTSLIDIAEFVHGVSKGEAGSAGNYVSKFAGGWIPQFIGRTAQSMDPTLRDLTPEDKGLKGVGERIANTVKSRIPAYSQTLPPVYSATGEPVTKQGTMGERWLSPAVISGEDEQSTPLVKGLDAAGYMPPDIPQSMKVEGPGGASVKVTLNAEERAIVAEAQAKVSKLMAKRMKTSTWQAMKPEDQEAELKSEYDDAHDEAMDRVRMTAEKRARE